MRVRSRCRSDGALVRDADLARCEVAQAAVDELRAPAARAVREVAPLDQHGPQAPARGIQRDPGARSMPPPITSTSTTGSSASASSSRLRRRALSAEGSGVRPRIRGGHGGRTARYPLSAVREFGPPGAAGSHSATSGADCTADWAMSSTIAASCCGIARAHEARAPGPRRSRRASSAWIARWLVPSRSRMYRANSSGSVSRSRSTSGSRRMRSAVSTSTATSSSRSSARPRRRRAARRAARA